MILLKNGEYLSSEGEFLRGDILIKDEIIENIWHKGEGPLTMGEIGDDIEVIDIEGMRIIPGLVDMHTHGAMGCDISIASSEEICKLAKYYSDNGITSFMPTTITDSRENIKKALMNIKKASDMDYRGASIEGVHVEGPFINCLRKGAHNEDWITLPETKDFDEYKEIMGDLKVHLTIAPEIEGGIEFIEYVVENGGTVGIGHTDGDYEMTLKGLEAGASVFTHLFNAMRGIHHREPGVVGAALSGDAFVEIIPDGIHVHPAVVKTAIKAKGTNEVVLITDSMHAAGYGEGEYDFGGSTIRVIGGVARQEDGTIAGSIISLRQGLKNAMEFTGMPLEEATIMASLNPAKVLGLDDTIGSIEVGKRGDLVVLDEDIEAQMVFCRGVRVK